MIPEQKISEVVKELLQANAPLTALLAAGPGSYGSAVYHDSLPEGEAGLATGVIVYQLVPRPDLGPANCSRADIVPCTVILIARKSGRSFPWSIVEAADVVLRGAKGLIDGVPYSITREGGIRPMSQEEGGKQYRAAGSRYLVQLTPGR